MNEQYNKNLTGNARKLRKEMTKEERHLWYDYLKSLPVTVHRQKCLGAYIVDFYIASGKIVIEVDGSQHFDLDGQIKDEERDAYLNKQGIMVLRFSNADINENLMGVCLLIDMTVSERVSR